MAGTFELFVDEDSRIRFRLVMPDGHVLAVSGQFNDKQAAAAAIKEVRECAGTGLIRDVAPTPTGRMLPSPPQPCRKPRDGIRRLNSLGAA
ncbi:YegP family protein [Pseudarthrobacter sp. BRE9]|uniref:YegP family protein n=1 Tax=Pseudarthrobacter sp. BRE9 TaxID=2962582 RepID=UPI0037C9D53C